MIDDGFFQENERTAPVTNEKQFLSVGTLDCECGVTLADVTIAYETFGNPQGLPILVCHALSGDSHAIGWWERLIGPGKAMDTDRYFIVCSNSLGGCQGTTGPASLAPDGKPYGSRFPMILVGDMVEVQARLADHLGIQQWWCVAGGSMGGMQALEWTSRFPSRVRKAFITASCMAHSPMQIAINEVARQAILRDANFDGGDYYDHEAPKMGLSVARMIGHISFLSDAAFEVKFSRRLQGKEKFDNHFGVEFEVESYLNYQGDKFTGRFDANSLLHLMRAIDYYEWSNVERVQAEFLITSFSSDWLYTPRQSEALASTLQEAGKKFEYHAIDLPFGHDSFLLDGVHQAKLLRDFLDRE